MKHTITIFFILFINYFSLFSQNQNEFYDDGKIIFQFKPELNIKLEPLAKSYDENYINDSLFTNIVNEFDIYYIKQLHPNHEDSSLQNTYEISFNDYDRVEEILDSLDVMFEVLYSERKTIHKLFHTPNDSYYSPSYQWSLYKIGAEDAWSISTGSSSVVVAVLDDAFSITHPELENKVLPGRDVAENNDDPSPSGNNEGTHGTHVAGIVGAETNNNYGIASIGYNTTILPVKVGRDSDGVYSGSYAGIIWAADNGADIINMSWGGGSYSNYGRNAVNYAYGKGVILVGAAGNDNTEQILYPIAYGNIIAVASTDPDDSKSNYSQYGTWINISAPGSDIISTYPASKYKSLSGTSMSAPLVSGLIALMKSVNNVLPREDLINCLYNTAVDIDLENPSYIGKMGVGRIDAHEALRCVQNTLTQIDVSLVSIENPKHVVCDTLISPKIVLRNLGVQTIEKVDIKYVLDTDSIVVYNWTGFLERGEMEELELPPFTVSQGNHNLIIYTHSPNDSIDENFANDTLRINFTSLFNKITLPFVEDFESKSFFTNNWTIINPDNSITWEIIDSVGGTEPGNNVLKMDFFNYSVSGRRDALLSPVFDFSMNDTVLLTFEHAYRRSSSSFTDSLIIYVSTGCSDEFVRVVSLGESGIGNFATGYIDANDFTPTKYEEWCMGIIGTECLTVDLSEFAGFSSVIIKIESYNNNGNNLYIDNINIVGTELTDLPEVEIRNTETTICLGENVEFYDLSKPAVINRSWAFEGGNPGFSNDKYVLVNYDTIGVWNVDIEVENTLGSVSNLYSNLIIVNPKPTYRNIVDQDSQLSVNVENEETIKWYLDGKLISNANESTYTPLSEGFYYAQITNSYGCSIKTNSYQFFPKPNVNEITNYDKNIKIIPNPASESFVISIDNDIFLKEDFDLEIYDISGKLLLNSYTFENNNIFVDIKNLENGVYFIRLKSLTRLFFDKIVISK